MAISDFQALAEYKDKHERRMLAEAKAWEAGKSLIHAKAKVRDLTIIFQILTLLAMLCTKFSKFLFALDV